MSLPEENGPLFLLALDGGGIRGVSELLMLDCIMRRLQKKTHLEELPRPCDYFDMIGGTSTGGLIAILLGRLQMTTEEALKAYDEVAEILFSWSNRKIPTTAQFKATTLEDVVKEIVAGRSDSDLLKYQNPGQLKGKAFVCAVDEAELGSLHRLRTYDTDGSADEWLKDCKVWEAARATTAAPLNFKPMTIQRDDNKRTYVDAGLGYNNPVEQLLDEACSVFHRERTLGALVSLGAGTRQMSLANPGEANFASYWASVAGALKSEVTDSERAHRRVEARFKRCPDAYYRFNVPDAADEVKLAEWKKMGELKDMTMAYIGGEAVNQRMNDLVELLSNKRKPEGLTLKYIGLLLDRKDFLKNSQRAQAMGSSSNFFTGRREVLQSLDDRFSVRPPGDRQRREFLVCGMGGAGKTQIAHKFFETRGKQLFKHCFWIDATDIYSAQGAYEEIAPEAFPEKVPSSVSMTDVQKWMASLEEEWLLVLDNSNDDDIRQFVPPGKTGNILYTSRRHNLAASLHPDWVAEINEMEIEDAITLLLLTSGEITYSPERRAEASRVVQELGQLPLAIDQAGAYIRRRNHSLIQYLELFRSQREELLRNPESKVLLRDPIFKGSDPRNQAVYATFDISFNALREIMEEQEGSRKGEDARNALNILRLICFYHNDSVMVQMFQQAAESRSHRKLLELEPLGQGKDSLENLVVRENNEWDSDPLMFGLMVLEDFSLVKWDDQRSSVSMHVLIYEWARATIGNRDMARRATYAKSIVFDSVPIDASLSSYSYRWRIYPHIEACLRRADMSQESDTLLAGYMVKLGVLYHQTGQLEDARDVFHRAISLSRAAHGPDHKETVKLMRFFAALEKEDGRLVEAESQLLQAVDLCQMEIDYVAERQHEHKQPGHAWPRWSLAFTKRPKESMEAAAKEDENLLRKARLRKAKILQDLAGVYTQQSAWDAAEDAILRATEIFAELNLPKSEDGMKRCLGVISAARDGTHRGKRPLPADEARALLGETVNKYGIQHDKTMEALEALLEALIAARDTEVARDLSSWLVNWCTDVYGPHGARTLNARHLHFCTLMNERQYLLAESHMRAILEDSQKANGPGHSRTVDCLLFLGAAIGYGGRFDEGEMLFAKGVEVLESLLPPTHLRVRLIREAFEAFKISRAGATANAARGLVRDAFRQLRIFTKETVVEDERFERIVHKWARYNHIARDWGTGQPEQLYFSERPPLVNPLFVTEMEEQERQLQLEHAMEHSHIADESP